MSTTSVLVSNTCLLVEKACATGHWVRKQYTAHDIYRCAIEQIVGLACSSKCTESYIVHAGLTFMTSRAVSLWVVFQ